MDISESTLGRLMRDNAENGDLTKKVAIVTIAEGLSLPENVIVDQNIITEISYENNLYSQGNL
jgi:hypothetical protein